MTGRNLAPDTGREISGLKRRVSDLERMLDRLRRDAKRGPATPPAAFAAYEGNGFSADGLHTTDGAWRSYSPANLISATAVDATRHLTVEGDWVLRVDVTGWYHFGVKVVFGTDSPDTGLRMLGIDQLDSPGLEQNHRLAVVPAVSPPPTYLTGDVIVYAQAGSRWQPFFADDRGVVSGAECTSFWAQLVSLANPILPAAEG